MWLATTRDGGKTNPVEATLLDVFYIDSKTAICYTIRTFIPMTFAVIKTGGKQYLVEEGQTLIVERLEHDGKTISFDEVLLVSQEGGVQVGQPLVKGASVKASVVEDGKGDKKIVFRYKAKTRSKKKKGHRQPYTKVKIESISAK